jgi:UDP-glucose 4-epimerase
VNTKSLGFLPKFSGLKVLVTGASGFIGSRLNSVLANSEAEVHAVSRTPKIAQVDGSRWWYGDLTDIETVRTVLSSAKPDVIFHLAGRAAGARELKLVLPTFHGNVITTINLLTVATEIGCQRIVLPASLEEPESTCATTIPSSPYAASKWASSAYARMFHALYRVPVVMARIFLAYGPGPESQNKLIPHVIRSLLQGYAPKLSSGQRLVDWIYIDDVVDGLLASALAPNVEGCTIDVGSGALVSIRELVEKIAQLVDTGVAPLFGALPDRPEEQIRIANTTYAREKLSWNAKTSLHEGLKYTVEWYRRQLNEL